MSYPKWKYRKHPELGVFQPTLVTTAEAEQELGSEWSDDPASTGFAVRPASSLHVSHIVEGTPLHEVAPSDGRETQTITSADIAILTAGDIQNA